MVRVRRQNKKRKKSSKRRLRKDHPRSRRKNKKWCCTKSHSRKKGVFNSQVLWESKRMQTEKRPLLARAVGKSWVTLKSSVCVEAEARNDRGELRMRERWGRCADEYKPLLSDLWMWKTKVLVGGQEVGLWEVGSSWRVVRSSELWMFQGQRDLCIREVRPKTPSKGKVSFRTPIRQEHIPMSTGSQFSLRKKGKWNKAGGYTR